MKRTIRILVAFGLVAAMTGLFAGTAAAQDPAITITPAAVTEAGDVSLTIEGENYPEDAFLLTCAAPSADAADIVPAAPPACTILGTATPTDGSFSAEVSVSASDANWGDFGIGIVASTAGGAGATAVLAIDPDLADTGVESGLIAIIGLAVVAGGAMVVGTARRRA